MRKGFRNSQRLPIELAVFVLTLAVLACNIGGSPAVATRVSPATAAGPDCLKGIFPGKTTKNEVIGLLGYPLSSQPEADSESLLYASAMYGQFNSISLQGGVVVQVSVVQPAEQPLAWSDVKAQYGEPAHTAYSNYLQGSQVYAFPAQGRAFVADAERDVVFIQQCFVPMSLENYIAAYGKLLPAADPFTR